MIFVDHDDSFLAQMIPESAGACGEEREKRLAALKWSAFDRRLGDIYKIFHCCSEEEGNDGFYWRGRETNFDEKALIYVVSLFP